MYMSQKFGNIDVSGPTITRLFFQQIRNLSREQSTNQSINGGVKNAGKIF